MLYACGGKALSRHDGTVSEKVKDLGLILIAGGIVMMVANLDPELTAATRVRENPYIGPRPFKQKHRAYFFGRDEEARCLLARLIARGLLVFYAPSGAGKSSLINARLIPDLRKYDYDVLPVTRVGHQLPAGMRKKDVRNIFIFNLLRSLTKDSGMETFRNQELKDFLAQHPTAQSSEEETAGRVLIIDQLEELFTCHPEQWQHRADFFRQVREALEADRSLLILLALREDFVAGLDRYAPAFPNGLNDRFRMERLLHDEAVEAVIGPTQAWIKEQNLHRAAGKAEIPVTYIFPPVSPDDPNEAAKLLVQNLRQIRARKSSHTEHYEFVEAVQLQVVCQRLWENLKHEMPRPITPKDIRKHAKVDVALEEFYRQGLKSVLNKFPDLTEEQLRNWFSEKLITGNGIRAQVIQETDDAGNKTVGGLPAEVVERLRQKSLVRYEDVRGGRWYELSHDSLIVPIRKSNREWMKDSPLQIAARLWAAKRDDLREHTHSRPTRFYELSTSLIGRHFNGVNDWLQWPIRLYRRHKLSSYLFTGEQLKEAEAQAEKTQGLLDEVVREFIQESKQAKAAWQSAEKVGLLIGVLLLAAASGYAWFNRNVAIRESKLAGSREFSAYAHSLLTVAPERTLLLALEAMHKHPSAEAQRILSQSVLAARLKQVFRQDSAPRKVALSPEGNRIAIVNEQNALVLIDAISGLELSRHSFPASLVAVSFNSDGKWLAIASGDDLIRVVMTTEPKQEVAQFTHHGALALAFSPDGRWLASGGHDQSARLWDLNAKRMVRDFNLHSGDVQGIAFSPDGQQLATACTDGFARIWNVDAGNVIYTYLHRESQNQEAGHAKVYDVRFSPNGKFLATAGSDGLARVWNLKGNATTPAYQFSHGDEVQAVAFSPTDGTQPNLLRLATASRTGIVRVWSVEQQQELLSLTAHIGAINSLAFSPDGKLLLTSGNDPSIKLWDAVARHSVGIEAVTYNAGGSRLATLGQDGRVIMWETATNQPLFDFDASRAMENLAANPNGSNPVLVSANDGARFAPRMKTLAFNPDGGTLVVAGSEGIIVYNANFGNLVLEQPVPSLTAMALNPQRDLQPKLRQVVAADARGALNSWELWSTEPAGVHQYLDPQVTADSLSGRAHEKTINDLVFSPNQGQWLASASDDKTVKIWDEAKKLQATLRHEYAVTAVAFSANGQYVAAAGAPSGGTGSSVVLWDWQKNQQLWTGQYPTAINDVVFRPDDYCIVTAATDGTVRVWDFETGAKKEQFQAHEGRATAVAFSADHQIFATVGEDKALQIHYRTPSAPALLQLARERLVGDWMTDDCGIYLHMPCEESNVAKGIQAFLHGKQAALQNHETQAVESFDQAQRLYPVFQFDSLSEVRRWQQEAKLVRQLNLTFFDQMDTDTVAHNIEDLVALLRTLPDVNSGQTRLVLLGERLARQGRVQNALFAYEKAKNLIPERHLSAAHLNNLCWYGSVWSYARLPFDARILQAGEEAVQLEPNNVNFLDSRGLARALSGKDEDAKADFEAYLKYLKSRRPSREIAQQIAQRRRWLAQLRQPQAFTILRPAIQRDMEQLRRE
jgi:WD40 repeat protein